MHRLLPLLLLLPLLSGSTWSGALDYEILRYRPEAQGSEAALLRRMLVRTDSTLAAIERDLRAVAHESQRGRLLLQDQAALGAHLERIRESLGGLGLIERWYLELQGVPIARAAGAGRIRLRTPVRSLEVDLAAGRVRVLGDPVQDLPLPAAPEPLPPGEPVPDEPGLRQLVLGDLRLRYRPDRPNPFIWTRPAAAEAEDPLQMLARAPGLPIELRISLPDGGWQAWRLIRTAAD